VTSVLLALAVLLLFAAVALAGEAVALPARERRAALQRVLARPHAEQEEPHAGFAERVVAPLGPALARLALRLSRGATVQSVRLRLLAAGIRDLSATTYLAVKAALGLGGALVGLALGAAAGPGMAFVLGLALAAFGFVGPEFVLSSRARRRSDEIGDQLPDALDLLAVSVEAGLGFDASMSKITERMQGPLIDELTHTLGGIRIGRSRHEALRSMADRVDSAEVGAFVRAVIQAEQLGLPLSRSLRVQAEDSRRRRQASAEERAMKAPVKMLFPTVLFIFPALFVVVLGPALMNLAELF
jgi:tight adherence protein C